MNQLVFVNGFWLRKSTMRPQLRRFVPLADLLQEAIRFKPTTPEEIIEEMRLKWPEWLPDALAKQSSPIKINRHQLIVGVFGASWAQEMEFSKPSLLESLKKSYPSLGLTEIRSQRLTRPSLSI